MSDPERTIYATRIVTTHGKIKSTRLDQASADLVTAQHNSLVDAQDEQDRGADSEVFIDEYAFVRTVKKVEL